jgi:hypothetical protein
MRQRGRLDSRRLITGPYIRILCVPWDENLSKVVRVLRCTTTYGSVHKLGPILRICRVLVKGGIFVSKNQALSIRIMVKKTAWVTDHRQDLYEKDGVGLVFLHGV